MAIPEDILPPEDDFDPAKAEDPDATALPDPKIAKIEGEHDKLIGDLGAIEEPPSATAMQSEHDSLIEGLANVESGPRQPDLLEQVQSVTQQPRQSRPADIPQQPGRYYVPPAKRTPENRNQRRAEHDRILNDMRSSVEKQIEPPQRVEEFDQDWDDRQPERFDNALEGIERNVKTGQSRTNQSAVRMFEALAEATVDMSQEIERNRMRLEQNRL